MPGNGELTCSVSLACKQHRKQEEKTPLPLVFPHHPLVTSLNNVPTNRREVVTESSTIIMEQVKRNLELRDDESVLSQIPLWVTYCKSCRSIFETLSNMLLDTLSRKIKWGRFFHWILFGQKRPYLLLIVPYFWVADS